MWPAVTLPVRNQLWEGAGVDLPGLTGVSDGGMSEGQCPSLDRKSPQVFMGGKELSSGSSSGWGSSRARRLCSRAMASAECLHFSEPHWQVKYLLLMSQNRSP